MNDPLLLWQRQEELQELAALLQKVRTELKAAVHLSAACRIDEKKQAWFKEQEELIEKAVLVDFYEPGYVFDKPASVAGVQGALPKPAGATIQGEGFVIYGQPVPTPLVCQLPRKMADATMAEKLDYFGIDPGLKDKRLVALIPGLRVALEAVAHRLEKWGFDSLRKRAVELYEKPELLDIAKSDLVDPQRVEILVSELDRLASGEEPAGTQDDKSEPDGDQRGKSAAEGAQSTPPSVTQAGKGAPVPAPPPALATALPDGGCRITWKGESREVRGSGGRMLALATRFTGPALWAPFGEEWAKDTMKPAPDKATFARYGRSARKALKDWKLLLESTAWGCEWKPLALASVKAETERPAPNPSPILKNRQGSLLVPQTSCGQCGTSLVYWGPVTDDDERETGRIHVECKTCKRTFELERPKPDQLFTVNG